LAELGKTGVTYIMAIDRNQSHKDNVVSGVSRPTGTVFGSSVLL
jgi:hypothetical protein